MTTSFSSLGAERASTVPNTAITKDLLSKTSHAYDCFSKQQFSAKLQAYLTGYVVSVASQYSVPMRNG